MTVDAHLHLGDVEPDAKYPWASPPELVFSCSARPSEWGSKPDYPKRVKRFYGVHPWYAGEWSDEVRDRLASILESDPEAGVGEIGLDDARDGVPDIDEQTPVFESQLGIASDYGRVVTVHMLGHEKETLDCIRRCGGGVPVILHSFKSESYVKPFSDVNCYFSIGPRLLAKNRGNIRRVISAIPSDRLLLETDAPHMPRGFSSIDDVIGAVSEATGISIDEVAGTTTENLRRIS